jgi:hypothetical protein
MQGRGKTLPEQRGGDVGHREGMAQKEEGAEAKEKDETGNGQVSLHALQVRRSGHAFVHDREASLIK